MGPVVSTTEPPTPVPSSTATTDPSA